MIGERLGKYTIVETLGTGSMGTVYKAEDSEQHRFVAVKLVRSSVLYSAERRERFLHCLLAASKVRHPSVAQILEIGDDNDDFFVITPFLVHKTIDQVADGKPMPWRQALDFALGVTDALGAVHASGTVHRGIKPSNIWIDANGSVLLSDCCLARFTEIEKASRRSVRSRRIEFAEAIIPMGALAYMSPEQVRGSLVDYRSDIFSLGVVLYELLTGRHPFEARNSLSRMSAILEGKPAAPSARVAGIPPELDAVLERTLAKRPGDRYQSAGELAAGLRVIRDTCTSDEVCAERRSLSTAILVWFCALAALIATVILYLARR